MSNGTTTKQEALLTGDGLVSGKAVWEVLPDRVKFKVEVEDGTPGDVLDIVVDGITIGQLTLDGVGFGEIEFQDPPDDNPDPNEVPLPDNFPSDVGQGTMVMVGSLSGALQPVDTTITDDSPTDDDGSNTDDDDGNADDNGGADGAGDTKLEALLTGDGFASGKAIWEVLPDRVKFKVEVEDGTPGDVLDIVVDGVTIGQLTLDGVGFGEIEFQDPPDDNPDPNEVPLPDNFPSDVGQGTMVMVGLLSGIL